MQTMMKHRKAIAFVLTLAMLFSIMPVAAWADDAQPVQNTVQLMQTNAEMTTAQALMMNIAKNNVNSTNEWMIMDMAFRLAQENPSIDDYRKVPGIVMIDEIDMHLHPAWQWRILEALHKAFPKIQFIVATHSPIIISSAKNAWGSDMPYKYEQMFEAEDGSSLV